MSSEHALISQITTKKTIFQRFQFYETMFEVHVQSWIMFNCNKGMCQLIVLTPATQMTHYYKRLHAKWILLTL